MPAPRDLTMLKTDSKKVLMAMATAEMEPIELSEKSGVSKNVVYAMRKGILAKPKHIGMIARTLGVSVADLIE